jgi:hypothetical protein
MSEQKDNYIIPLQFAELGDDGLLWLEALPPKTWQTLQFGEVSVTMDNLKRMIDNFKSNVRGQEIATDYDHGMDAAKGNRASGWFRNFKIKNGNLWAGIEPTPTAMSEIKNKEWKYFSLEWLRNWKHPETSKVFEDVITGGALTNNPVAKGLVPINFSELYIEREGGKMEDEVKNEHAAEEHAPPGGEPDPEVNKDDAFPDRHLTVPGDNDEDTTKTNKKDEEEEVSELEKQLREKLGLSEDADIIKAVDDLKEEVGPLREVAKQFSEKKAFKDAYPEQAAELDKLKKASQIDESIKFSEKFGEKRTDDKGLSQLSLEKIRDMHIKFSEGSASSSDLDELLETLTDDKAYVKFGEKGSGRVSSDNINMRELSNPRVAFAEKVKEIQEADELEYDAAIKLASEKYPELAEAYNTTVRA